MNTGNSLISALSAVFRPVCPVEPISAFYGQDGQEEILQKLKIAYRSNIQG